MATKFYQAKVAYEKTLEEGTVARVNESFLIDAMSFTEAEHRMIKEMRELTSGPFETIQLQRKKIVELFHSEFPSADKWYRCKVMYITIDEEKGIEKRTANFMYVHAADIEDAFETLKKGMSTSLIDYEIHTVSETDIMDVFMYDLAVKSEQ